MRSMLAIIDATFKDNLEQLTNHRMPGALPFAGKFRLIDFTLSNMRNSKITNVAIFPYGNYRSLQDHVGSGKKWDLDRRRDGLFILPPKNLYILPGNMITFQRMYEHLEFLKRSRQYYAIITAPNIVWNIDFNDVLFEHIESGADVTEVMFQNIRLRTFIIRKKLLLDYVLSYDSLEYKTMLDLVDKAPNLKTHIYKHKQYTRTITDTFNYLKSNLDMLISANSRAVFRHDRPVFSKEKPSPPAKYLSNAKAENSMVSAGSIIDGTIINCIVGRDVFIKKGAVIKNSYVMSGSFIEEYAHIEYAILDKQTVVKRGTLVTGTLREPYVSQKEQLVTNAESLRILMVASESTPFIKTGGLADVIGSLSRNLVRLGQDITVIIPLYKKIKDTFSESLKRSDSLRVLYDGEYYHIRLYTYIYKKVKYYFVESHDFFDFDSVYGLENDTDRFAFFNKVVVEMLDILEPFDLIHLNDWHTSLIPLLLHNSIHSNVKTLLSIHNINYQGVASNDIITKLGISNFDFRDDTINFLEIGINTATRLATVSPTYKEELKYEYYGKNLTYSLLKRERDFYGILNGISSSFNPETDKLIFCNYNSQNRDGKAKNKQFLQETMGLKQDPNIMVIGMVTRIVEHKGFDLIIHCFDDIFSNNDIQFVLLGTGDKKYETELLRLEKKFPNKIKLNLGYDATIPNYIYAGADIFLMPSQFEPCGLGQMIALKYGTIPLVRDTGGLADTVFKYDHLTRKGNGFKFYNYDSNELKNTILEANDIFKNQKDVWAILQKRAMKSDNTLKKSATKYVDFYRAITNN